MAEQVLPQHRPVEQLRTEPAAQREHTDKYVTSFESGKSEVDITFTNPVLNESADHFKVGVDELTVNLGKVSMLDYGTNDIVFRIIRRGEDDGHYDLDPELLMPNGPVGSEELYREAFEFKVDRPYSSFQEVLDKFVDINTAVNGYFNENVIDPQYFTAEYGADFRGEPEQHLQLTVNPKGQWVIMARQSFWANFVFQVPLLKYRSIFFDDVDQEFLSLHPETAETRVPFILEANGLRTTIPFLPQVTQNTFDGFAGNRALNRVFYAPPSLFHTLDRRVTIEVSSSLPLKNSPMVDHGEEAPDYILGRYMFHKPIEVSTSRLPFLFIF